MVVGFFLVVVGFLFQLGGGIFFFQWNVEGGILFSEIEGWNFLFRWGGGIFCFSGG